MCKDINTDELEAWEDEGLDKPQADDSSLIAVVVVVDVTVATGVAQDVGGAGGRGWGRGASGQTDRHIQVQYDKHNAAAGTWSTAYGTRSPLLPKSAFDIEFNLWIPR